MTRTQFLISVLIAVFAMALIGLDAINAPIAVKGVYLVVGPVVAGLVLREICGGR
jgi:hypothetical protein